MQLVAKLFKATCIAFNELDFVGAKSIGEPNPHRVCVVALICPTRCEHQNRCFYLSKVLLQRLVPTLVDGL